MKIILINLFVFLMIFSSCNQNTVNDETRENEVLVDSLKSNNDKTCCAHDRKTVSSCSKDSSLTHEQKIADCKAECLAKGITCCHDTLACMANEKGATCCKDQKKCCSNSEKCKSEKATSCCSKGSKSIKECSPADSLKCAEKCRHEH